MEFIQSPNFSPGRMRPIQGIIIHRMAGTFEGAKARFLNPNEKASAHYLIRRDGRILQMVKDENTGWHAGNISNNGIPGSSWLRPNPNYCVTPDTLILLDNLTWIPAGELKPGDGIVGFTEDPIKSDRYFKRAHITQTGRKKAEVYQITLSDGTKLCSTGEHKWLTWMTVANHRVRWQSTSDMVSSLKSYKRKHGLFMPRYFDVFHKDSSYESGFIAAFYDSEGSISCTKGEGFFISGAQRENALLSAVIEYLHRKGYGFTVHKRDMNNPRFGNTKITKMNYVQIHGGRKEALRLLLETQPPRLIAKFADRILPLMAMRKQSLVEVESIKSIGVKEIVALSSDTKTYIAEGFGSHNTTIGIECEDRSQSDNDWWTPELVDRLSQLVDELCRKYNLPKDRQHVMGHSYTDPVRRPIDPGKFTPWDKILNTKPTNNVATIIKNIVTAQQQKIKCLTDGSCAFAIDATGDGAIYFISNSKREKITVEQFIKKVCVGAKHDELIQIPS